MNYRLILNKPVAQNLITIQRKLNVEEGFCNSSVCVGFLYVYFFQIMWKLGNNECFLTTKNSSAKS